MADHNEAMRLADLFELEPDPESLYRQAAAELRNLLAANLYMKDLTDQALDDVRALTAERDQLRAEVERLSKTDAEILACNYPDGEENGPTISAPDYELISFARQLGIRDAARTTHKETE